ncbi:MAG: hypothetical protein IKP01_02070 [Bacteroidales bacterium]|nr:hypothetical protein [Bacteroidales bacterium]
MGFKNTKWTEVEEAGTSRMLPAGGYVAVITAVEDIESKEYLRFTYDIAEGDLAGFFETEDRAYTHQFTRSYKARAKGFMKRFLVCVEESSPGFSLGSWDNDPMALVGKKVGIVVQREDYTNRDGDDRARMNVEDFAKADDIRHGRFVMPEPKDNRAARTDGPPADGATVYDADIPF